jgi:hypothetical protein
MQVDTTINPTQIAILILPFLIGFSAALFMAIITRMVSGTALGAAGRRAWYRGRDIGSRRCDAA